MASEEHQSLLNGLAKALEKEGVNITNLDIDGMPQFFEPKYQHLPTPQPVEGKIPDLVGYRDGVMHIGEAKTSTSGSNTEEQLSIFGCRAMRTTRVPIPLHVIVPPEHLEEMKSLIRKIGLGNKIGTQIHIWS